MVDAASGAALGASSASNTSIKRLTKDFDKFLTLLTTQLKNQDPLDPVDTAEFTNQLVQFASVEQLIQQNTNMEAFIKNQKFQIASNIIDYLGHTVETPTSRTTLSNGHALWNYDLQKPASSIFLHVVDPDTGRIVRSIPGNGDAGKHQVGWDGSTDVDGETVPDGDYLLTITAIDQEGKNMFVDVNGFGQVTSVELDGDEPAVVVFGRIIPISAIGSISHWVTAAGPSAGQNDDSGGPAADAADGGEPAGDAAGGGGADSGGP